MHIFIYVPVELASKPVARGTRIMKCLAACMLFAAMAMTPASAETPEPARGTILSAFFGLNDSLRIRVRANMGCRGLPGRGGDGMPVIFSDEVADDTLDAEDFEVRTRSGKIGRIDCVTLRPADEQGEKRTALLIGEFGSEEDQPVSVTIVGDLTSLDGDVTFKGATADVIPLEDGPTMILAEVIPQDQWALGGSDNCPAEGTRSMVRTTWVGGITKPGGDEIDEQEMQLYRVTARQADGSIETVAPLSVGDLNDNDNNHELCLGTDAQPVSVFFPAGHLTDPNEDLNPDSTVTQVR